MIQSVGILNLFYLLQQGFFRRYLQRKEPYKCMKEGQCEITDRRRGNCSACRMQKCVMVGMSRDGKISRGSKRKDK